MTTVAAPSSTTSSTSNRGWYFPVTSSIHSRSSGTPLRVLPSSFTTAFAAKGSSIDSTSSRLTASKYDSSGSGSFVFNVTSSSTRRILRLHRTQVAPRAERALRDVARRDERQRSDRVLVGDRLRLFLASAERFLKERLHRRASVERRQRNHADRLGRFLFRFLAQ